MTSLRGKALALVLTAALALSACGGDSETTTVTTDTEAEATTPTVEADKAAIESLMLGFGASVGKEACEFYSVDFLAEVGSLKTCERQAADITAATFAVDDVTVKGDKGSVTVHRTDPRGKKNPITYPVVRDKEPTDSFGGWRIDGNYADGSG